MSYCRDNGTDSEVYVVSTHNTATKEDGWWCCGCRFEEDFFETRQGMIEHLLLHREEGDKVPEGALERLKQEIAAE